LPILEQAAGTQKASEVFQRFPKWMLGAIYATILAVAIAIWLVAVRAPLWLDETVSYWQIHRGFSQIASRQGLSFGAYSYLLWCASKLFGTSEVSLRIPSILAMLGAVYLLYRAARELFDDEIAVIAAVVFCLHPVVAFAAIDVRPYAFGALAINGALFSLIRWRRSPSAGAAAMFGVLAAFIVYFHFLFTAALPGFALCFALVTKGEPILRLRQASTCLAAFGVAFLPVIPGLLYMFRTSGSHVFDESPPVTELVRTLAPPPIVAIFLVVALAAAAGGRIDWNSKGDSWTLLLCASVGLAPVLILYATSIMTPLHVFVARYRMVGISGIALCWGFLLSRIDSRLLRLMFCAGCVLAGLYHSVAAPEFRRHGYTWKYALELAENNASTDGAPVVICSDLPEADHMPMPQGADIKDSTLFAPLTYYPLSVPVVPLPRALNAEAVRLGSEFLREATVKKERFLAVAYIPSYPTLEWLRQQASATHEAHRLGESDGITIIEFVPHTQVGHPSGTGRD